MERRSIDHAKSRRRYVLPQKSDSIEVNVEDLARARMQIEGLGEAFQKHVAPLNRKSVTQGHVKPEIFEYIRVAPAVEMGGLAFGQRCA